MTTVFAAKRILTMDPAHPEATHVAVKDGRVVRVGMGAVTQTEGTLDTRFAQQVLMPGFVEGHSHITEGTYWRYTYAGYFDRDDPDGRRCPGSKSIDGVLERLREAAKAITANAPLAAWGFDPIYYGERRCGRADLDLVSRSRAVGLAHASGHALSVNSRALDLAGLLRLGIDHPGVPLGSDGLPFGELRGADAMALAAAHIGLDRNVLASDELGLRYFARTCVRRGVTTATDMASLLPQDAVEMMLRVTREPNFPVRLVSLRRLQNLRPHELVERVSVLRDASTDRLRLGSIKIVVDGSIQGFSARLCDPGYHNGAANGLWYVSPEELLATLELALERDIQVHLHTNGDQATELVLDCVETVLGKIPCPDHRITLQHAQLASAAHFRRMKALGMCVNLFANHLYYWGDQHYATTVGPERAQRMNACASALQAGVPLAIHSDAPVTPLGPLFTAWCAVNRQSASGRVLGDGERIGVDAALRAITLGAAYTLKLDAEIGSIEPGKRADFAVLDEDPAQIGAERLKDVRVWGTVQGGRVFRAGWTE